MAKSRIRAVWITITVSAAVVYGAGWVIFFFPEDLRFQAAVLFCVGIIAGTALYWSLATVTLGLVSYVAS